ncbi:MAG: hypothetical protein H7A52_01935 [Akkermansiaceae bacterium]|nr:hypothetical protein [Akkermansiaceae bacterium]
MKFTVFSLSLAFVSILFLSHCVVFSQGGMDPTKGVVFIDMEKHGNLFAVRLGDRFRTKKVFVFEDVPGFDRMIVEEGNGGVPRGAQVLQPGMEVELVNIKMSPFGPIAYVKILKPIKENRPTPIISLFDSDPEATPYKIDDTVFERIEK